MPLSALYTLILVTAVFTAAVSSVLGMAGGTLLMAVLTLVLPMKMAIPLHGWAQFCSNAGRVFAHWRHIEWRIAIRFSILVIPGAALGVWTASLLDERWLGLALGVAIVWILYGPKPRGVRQMPLNGFVVLGFGSSLVGMIVGASGPLIAPFFFGRGLEKKKLIATKAFCQAVVQVTKLPAFFLIGAVNLQETGWLLVGLTVTSAIGTWIGTRVLDRIDEVLFEKLIRWTLTVIAVKMIYTGVVA